MKLPDRIQFGTESVGPPAGFWTRLVAHFVDQILLGILVFVLNMIVAGSLVDTYSDGALYFDWYTVPKFMWWLISITVILEVLYFTVAISTWGKTIGKAMLGIKVVRQDGSRISYARSLVRCVIYLLQLEFVIGLSFIVIAFNPKKQGIHDMICDTGVVRV